MNAHPGFKSAAASISKRQGISAKRAGAILAASTRRSSASARKKNPRLNRVKGYNDGGMVAGMRVKKTSRPGSREVS